MANTCKYLKMQKFVSYNSGATWQPLNEYKKGMLYESDSVDCGGGTTQYRWYPSGTTCVGYDLYNRSIRQYSNDGGESWTNVSPAEYTATTLIEANSEDCGYVPPTTYKWLATYASGITSAECDSTSAITSGEVTPYPLTSIPTFVEIGDCVTTLDNGAFKAYGIMSGCTIGRNVTTIGNEAFYGCYGLTSITIPDSVTSIGQNAFLGCEALSSVTLSNSLTSIGYYVFRNCTGLTNVTIPNSVTTIGQGSFSVCSGLTSCTIGSGVTSIGIRAFEDCRSLTSIDIPNSVTSIDQLAFWLCSGATSLTIGSGVTSIGDGAFDYCTSLSSITINATTPPTIGWFTFEETNNCPIYVPAGSVNAYKSASVWSQYSSRIQAIP